MPISQEIRTEGFRANLSVRGVSVRVANGPYVGALTEVEKPDPARFVTSNATRNAGKLVILREDLAGYAAVSIGDVWTQSDGTRHRVTEVTDNPADIAVKYGVETSPAA